MGFVWRIAGIAAWISGSKPTITHDSARNAFSYMSYDASKIKKALAFQFRTADETIENTVKGRFH
jgi:hypothetical protein